MFLILPPPSYIATMTDRITAMTDGRVLRVLLMVRPDLNVFPAGDTVQVARTMKALANKGAHVSVTGETRPDLGEYHIVHVFNLMRVDEAFLQVDHAFWQRIPVIVTPLYWNIADIAKSGGPADKGWLRRWPGEQRLRSKVLRMASAVVVGAEAEKVLLERDFRFSAPCYVVPVGADGMAQAGDAAGDADFPRRHELRDFILCVARVGPHKNQLGLISALSASRKLAGVPLVFIGQIQDRLYFSACRASSGPGTLFLGYQPASMVASAYRTARVHVLASWCELPGLSTLEAAACGTRVVTTSRGSAADYLGGLAWYCDPADEASIRLAVEAAWAAPVPIGLRAHVRGYTWERAAETLLNVYRSVLGWS